MSEFFKFNVGPSLWHTVGGVAAALGEGNLGVVIKKDSGIT